MNTNDIREHLLSRSPWVNRERTVDTVKAGDPNRPVRTVGVGWFPSIENLRAAVELGCDLFVCHEPLYWNHRDERDHIMCQIEPGLTRKRLLERTGLVVLRNHDCWDNWPKVGIRDSWADWLGLTNFLTEDKSRWHAVYAIEPQPLKRFARHVASRVWPLGEDSVQVIGDPERIVSRPAVGVGCGGPDKDMVDAGADVLIVCYDGGGYWPTRQRLNELGAAIITVEHGSSEIPGMANCAKYLVETFPELTVHHLEQHARTWTVKAPAAPRYED